MLCWECLAVADESAKGWRAYRGEVPGEDVEPILLFYCPSCAEREFDGPLAVQSEVRELVRTLWRVAESATETKRRNRAQTIGRYLRKRFAR